MRLQSRLSTETSALRVHRWKFKYTHCASAQPSLRARYASRTLHAKALFRDTANASHMDDCCGSLAIFGPESDLNPSACAARKTQTKKIGKCPELRDSVYLNSWSASYSRYHARYENEVSPGHRNATSISSVTVHEISADQPSNNMNSNLLRHCMLQDCHLYLKARVLSNRHCRY